MADIRVCSHGKTSPCDYCRLTVMLALHKQLDPDAPDAVVIPADLLARAPLESPERIARTLESERRELTTLIRMCLQQFEFQYGKRQRGWDAKFLMGRLESVLARPVTQPINSDHIGALIDGWEALPNDIKADVTEAAPLFVKAIADIYAEIHYPE